MMNQMLRLARIKWIIESGFDPDGTIANGQMKTIESLLREIMPPERPKRRMSRVRRP